MPDHISRGKISVNTFTEQQVYLDYAPAIVIGSLSINGNHDIGSFDYSIDIFSYSQGQSFSGLFGYD